jgi:hypothetical protein
MVAIARTLHSPRAVAPWCNGQHAALSRPKYGFDSRRGYQRFWGVLAEMASNVLYLAILPLIHVSASPVLGFGFTEETLTLVPDKNFATEFFEDEVDGYIVTFKNHEKYLTGGHVIRFEVNKEPAVNGRVIVRVVQHVA